MQGQCLSSPFSLFSSWEGTGSKALTHPQVPFRPFFFFFLVLCPLNLVLLSSHPTLPSVFIPFFPLKRFVFPFCLSSFTFSSIFLIGFTCSCPSLPVVLCHLPFTLTLTVLFSPFLFYLTLSHIPIVLSCLFITHSFIFTASPHSPLPYRIFCLHFLFLSSVYPDFFHSSSFLLSTLLLLHVFSEVHLEK